MKKNYKRYKRNQISQSLIVIMIFCLCVFGESCTSKKDNINNTIVSISPIDSLSIYLGLPVSMKYYDDKLFISDLFGENGLIHVVDIKGDRILFSFTKKGNGPNEYQHISTIDIYEDNSSTVLGILDPITKTYRQYLYDSLLIHQSKTQPLKEAKIQTDITLTDLYKCNAGYLSTGITDRGKFILFTDSFTVENYQGNYRPKPNKAVSDFLHAKANFGRTFISPDRKTIASIVFIAGTLDVFKLINGNVQQTGEHVIHEIDYSVESSSAIKNESLTGYISGDITDEYIYALYSGEKENLDEIANYGRQIHVFDHNGTLMKKYDIQKPAFAIGIDPKKKQLYAVTHIPEPRIFIYKLDE